MSLVEVQDESCPDYPQHGAVSYQGKDLMWHCASCDRAILFIEEDDDEA